jgi:transcriptional regulator with XRE-family HTH domain
MSESLHRAQVGRRLRAAIEALGVSQTEVAKGLEITPSKLGNWLRGDNYPAEWFVKRFCDRYGVTTEWIYRGIVTGMASELADTLWRGEQVALQKEMRATRSVRDRRPPSVLEEMQEYCKYLLRYAE